MVSGFSGFLHWTNPFLGPAQAPGSTRKKCPKLQATESCPASDGKDSNFNLFDAPHENTVPFVWKWEIPTNQES